jgi:predicted nucleic acid-binding protein
VRVIDASVLAAFIRKEPGWERLAEFVKLCTTVDLALKEVLKTAWGDYSIRKIISIDLAMKLRQIL